MAVTVLVQAIILILMVNNDNDLDDKSNDFLDDEKIVDEIRTVISDLVMMVILVLFVMMVMTVITIVMIMKLIEISLSTDKSFSHQGYNNDNDECLEDHGSNNDNNVYDDYGCVRDLVSFRLFKLSDRNGWFFSVLGNCFVPV